MCSVALSSRVVLCTDHSDKTTHRQVGMDRVVALGSAVGVMPTTLAWNARVLRAIPTVGTIFPIFITSLSPSDNIESFLYIYIYIYIWIYCECIMQIFVIVNIKLGLFLCVCVYIALALH